MFDSFFFFRLSVSLAWADGLKRLADGGRFPTSVNRGTYVRAAVRHCDVRHGKRIMDNMAVWRTAFLCGKNYERDGKSLDIQPGDRMRQRCIAS